MNCLLTCYLTGRPDPKIDYSLPDEPLKQWLPDDDDVVKDWIEAVLALIEARMVTIDEVMLPYLKVDQERTLWQAYQEREQAALDAGGNG